jgi:ABC-2 type transport system permease protein
VGLEGSFSSYFTGKPSPLTGEPPAETDTEGEIKNSDEQQVILRQIDKSPGSSRLIVFGSNSFLSDEVISINSSVRRSNSLEPLQVLANTVNWSLEDRGLLTLRGRSHFSRPLIPLSRDQQMFWEYLNYGLVLAGLLLVWIMKGFVRKRVERRRMAILQQSSGRI